jgi:Tol biopolymer transport system component/DNA-binding winged helix-turn-helix (wHTH) protein
MDAVPSPTRLVRFGAFEFDRHTEELRKHGLRIKLSGQPMEVLAMLLARPGELIPREELQKRLWPKDTIVEFEHSINAAVKTLRRALSDSADEPRYIETLPRRGYRFIAPVEVIASPLVVAPVAEERLRWDKDPARFSGIAVAAPSRVVTRREISRWILWVGAIGATSVFIAGLLGFFLLRPLPPPRVVNYVRVTNDGLPKIFGSANLVTDGVRLYFTHVANQQYNLVQVSADGGDTVPIHSPFSSPYLAAISPNHTELLILDSNEAALEYPIWTLSPLGGSLRRLGDLLGHDGAWLPDGEHIVFAKGQDLFLTSTHGNESRKLVTLPGTASWLRWSPSGTRLRFTLSDPKSGSTSLWEVAANGANPRPVLPGWNNPAAECCGNWTPDGRYFLFQSTRAGKTGIYAMAEQSVLFRKPAKDPMLLTAGPFNYYSPVPSLDGKRIYVVGSQPRGEIQRYDWKTQQVLPYMPGLSAEGLDFSRDGKWVTYVAFPEGSLWRSKVDGSDKLQLSFPPMQTYLPRWSPDGTRIGFQGLLPGQPWRMYIISADGGNPQVVREGQGNIGWSSDGSSVVFGETPDGRPLIIHLLDLKTRQLSNVPGSDGLYAPRWSPDGRYLCAERRGPEDLWLFDFAKAHWKQLTTIGAGWHNWSHDAKYVYFDTFEGSDSVWYRVRITDGRLERSVTLKNIRRTGTYGWSGLGPDDSPLLLRDVGTEEIYALDVDFP